MNYTNCQISIHYTFEKIQCSNFVKNFLNGIETLTLSVLDPLPPRLGGVKPTMIQEETGVM